MAEQYVNTEQNSVILHLCRDRKGKSMLTAMSTEQSETQLL